MRMPRAIRNQGDPAVFQRIVLQFSDLFGLTSSWLKVSGWTGAVEHPTNFCGTDLEKTFAYTLTLSPKERDSFCATQSKWPNMAMATFKPF